MQNRYLYAPLIVFFHPSYKNSTFYKQLYVAYHSHGMLFNYRNWWIFFFYLIIMKANVI